jgi:tetraacyldisaccharide 4'-kinase
MTENFYLDVISGRRRGAAAALLRGLLTFGVPFYALASGSRNRLFDLGWKKTHKVEIPVISVGNLTTGGTGKTPVVAWLVHELLRQGHRPAIVSRGYRALNDAENDEKRLLELLCPGVPHVQDRDRVAAARSVTAGGTVSRPPASHPLAGEQKTPGEPGEMGQGERSGDPTGCDVIVLDDGFQHRRLQRDLDIVLIDALNPWGYGRLLPRGLLRERVRNLRRADVVLITRSELVGEERIDEIRRRVARETAAPVIATAFRATRLINAESRTESIEECAGRRVCAFCGIGHPDAFRRTLAGIGAPVSDDRFRILGDHHHYTEGELRRIAQWARGQHADWLLTTRKDLVKLQCTHLGGIPLWGVDLDLTFRDSPEPLLERLDQAVRSGDRPLTVPASDASSQLDRNRESDA